MSVQEPTSAEDWHEQCVAQAQAELDAAQAKVEKLKRHLDGAHEEAAFAEQRLQSVASGDHPEWVVPTEHVVAQAQ